ncbi:MAG: UDP-3-O-acyl-N-acetylglucosamine deacetylase [Alphaproteobacteria bacterium]
MVRAAQSKLGTYERQTTLGRSVTLSGVGVHSGTHVTMVIGPAAADQGVVFRRVGKARAVGEIRAEIGNIGATELCTTLSGDGWSVATVEHLLAGLSGLGIDNALIEIDGEEVPVMDGSSAAFIAAIDEAEIVELDARRSYIKILRPIRVEVGQSYAELRPCEGRRLEIELDYAHPIVGRQSFSTDVTPELFREELASARTFGFLGDVENLRARGLARGASLDNALVIGAESVINPEGLRFSDEFARHKALDSLGDLALAGLPVLGCYRSYRGGHSLNARVLEVLMATPKAWEIVEAPMTRMPRRRARPSAPKMAATAR